jgi:hypothetical protein
MVEGRVTAWCYVDTETGEVERTEVWAWEDEFTFGDKPHKPYVIAVNAEEDMLITKSVADKAREVAYAAYDPAGFRVVFDMNKSLLAQATDEINRREAAASGQES